MNLIWRFYLDNNRQWRWQHLAFNRDVLAQSHKGYKDYDGCVEDAQAHGYDCAPLQATQAEAKRHVRKKW